MPKVSVILSSFNHEQFIQEAIDSVLNQTFTDFELIIWDDASADNSWLLISQYTDPRIKAFRNEVQKRGVWGINKAIAEVAAGEYIAIHHSDDVWGPDKLEKQVAFLDTNAGIGAVFTNALAIGDDGNSLDDPDHFYSNIFDQPNRTRHEWLNRFFYQGNALCHPSVLIRKQCYEKCGTYRYGLAQLADFDMWIRLCLQYEIHVLPEKLVYFRVRANEANASGYRPETRIRDITERYYLLNNFLDIKTFKEIVTIFPEADIYYRTDGFESKFVLAMVVLGDNSPSWAKLFGLELLFDLIWDGDKAKEIQKLYGFDYQSLIPLTAKHDVFSVVALTILNQAVAERDGQLHILNQAVAERDGQLHILNQAVAERDGQLHILNQVVAEQDGQLHTLNQDVTHLKLQLGYLTNKLAESEHQLGDCSRQAIDLNQRVDSLKAHLAGREHEIFELVHSLSWKITAPLRIIAKYIYKALGK